MCEKPGSFSCCTNFSAMGEGGSERVADEATVDVAQDEDTLPFRFPCGNECNEDDGEEEGALRMRSLCFIDLRRGVVSATCVEGSS